VIRVHTYFFKIKAAFYKYLFFSGIFLLSAKLYPAGDSIQKIKLLLNSGLILNRAFSHLKYKPNTSYKFGNEEYKPLGNGNILLPGFFAGINLNLKRSEKRIIVFGLGCSYTRSSYNYSKSTTSVNGYMASVSTQNIDIKFSHLLLNYEFGIRRKLFGNFRMQNSLLLHQNLYSAERQQGRGKNYQISGYPFIPDPAYNFEYDINQTNVYTFNIKNGFTGLSYRFGLLYHLSYKKLEYEFIAFRNFGTYQLPFWGFGFSVYLN
jgi:hypothetical protein